MLVVLLTQDKGAAHFCSVDIFFFLGESISRKPISTSKFSTFQRHLLFISATENLLYMRASSFNLNFDCKYYLSTFFTILLEVSNQERHILLI